VNELSITPLIFSPVDSPSFTGSPGQCQAMQRSSRSLGRRPLAWPRRLRTESLQAGDPLPVWSVWEGRNCDHAPMSLPGSHPGSPPGSPPGLSGRWYDVATAEVLARCAWSDGMVSDFSGGYSVFISIGWSSWLGYIKNRIRVRVKVNVYCL
jgi:hypothetical protein